jgi:hypothetical protein
MAKMAKMKRVVLRWVSPMLGCLCAVAASACCVLGKERWISCQVKVGNHSEDDINFVVIDAGGEQCQFGYVGHGGKGTKGASGCCIRCIRDFYIEWKESGQVMKAPIDLLRYQAVRQRVRSFSFYYEGEGRWTAVAQDGIGADAKVILP